MNFRDLMGRVDSRIDASPISDTVTLPAGGEVRGRFFSSHHEHELRDGSVLMLEISFSCQAVPAVLQLSEGELVHFDGRAYRFVRRLPDRGDEVGRVIVELGTA